MDVVLMLIHSGLMACRLQPSAVHVSGWPGRRDIRLVRYLYYIPPVVALAIRALIVGEPIGLADYSAAILIIIRVILLKRR